MSNIFTGVSTAEMIVMGMILLFTLSVIIAFIVYNVRAVMLGRKLRNKPNTIMETTDQKLLMNLGIGSHCMYNGEVVVVTCVGTDLVMTENPKTMERVTHIAPNIGPLSGIPITPETLQAFGFEEETGPTKGGCWSYRKGDEVCVIPKGPGSAYVRVTGDTVVGHPSFLSNQVCSIHELENIILVCLGERLGNPISL